MTAYCGVTLVVYERASQSCKLTLTQCTELSTQQLLPWRNCIAMRAPGMTQEFGGHLESSYDNLANSGKLVTQ